MLVEILTPDFIFEDERGSLVQLVHNGFKQFNIIRSNSGVLRGNHYHKQNREAFYIIDGEIKLVLKDAEKEEEYIFKTGDMFAIRPNILHSFYFVRETLLASMYDQGVEMEDGTKDIFEK